MVRHSFGVYVIGKRRTYRLSSPCKEDDFSTPKLLPTLSQTLGQIDLIHNLIARYPQHLGFVEKADDIMPTFRSGKIASMIGVEGLHQIANSASVLRSYHRLGVRYVTLCHDSNTKWADASVGVLCDFISEI